MCAFVCEYIYNICVWCAIIPLVFLVSFVLFCLIFSEFDTWIIDDFDTFFWVKILMINFDLKCPIMNVFVKWVLRISETEDQTKPNRSIMVGLVRYIHTFGLFWWLVLKTDHNQFGAFYPPMFNIYIYKLVLRRRYAFSLPLQWYAFYLSKLCRLPKPILN